MADLLSQREESSRVIDLSDVEVQYGPVEALKGVTLSVEPGTRTAIVGPNGAGKSTLLKVLVTLVTPTRGQVTVLGLNPVVDPNAVRRKICYVPQDRAMDVLLTVEDNLRLFAMLSGIRGSQVMQRVSYAAKFFGLENKRKQRIFQLSGGQMRRIQLCRILLSDAPILILDEPTLGIDPSGKEELWGLLVEQVRTAWFRHTVTE